MPAQKSFDFATIRIVPRVERGEFVNAGVILFCLADKFLDARIDLNQERLKALWPAVDFESIKSHLEAFRNICKGSPDAGPIGQLPVRERFHWLVAPRSTMIQISPVHTGLCELPQNALDDLFRRMIGQTDLQ